MKLAARPLVIVRYACAHPNGRENLPVAPVVNFHRCSRAILSLMPQQHIRQRFYTKVSFLLRTLLIESPPFQGIHLSSRLLVRGGGDFGSMFLSVKETARLQGFVIIFFYRSTFVTRSAKFGGLIWGIYLDGPLLGPCLGLKLGRGK